MEEAEVTMLTRRQELAQALTDTLRNLGAFVSNPLPLRDNDALRFDIPRDACTLVCGKLLSWGWRPFPLGETTRILPEGNAALPQQVMVYELMLPRDKPPPPARQSVFGELADPAEKARKKRLGIR
jgi:hypothetical protein